MNCHPNIWQFMLETYQIEGYNLQNPTKITEKKLRHNLPNLMSLILRTRHKPLTAHRLGALHRAMLVGVLNMDLGQYRTRGVQVGQHIAPAPQHLPTLMQSWINAYNVDETHPLEQHLNFQNIHPFADGNGRIGRILWLLSMMKHNVPPTSFLKQFGDKHFRNNQRRYYRLCQLWDNKIQKNAAE